MSFSRARPAGPLTPEALHEIVEGTATETGERFFDELVRRLARATGTKCAWVTEWIPESRRLRALSFWAGDRYIPDYEYAIAGTPCEPVIEERRLFLVPERVVELFRQDPGLADLGSASYIGVPLLDVDGRILGHLGVLDDSPLSEDEPAVDVFRIFAGRAGAELRRLRRDRELRERERKMSRILGGAMDAIVELDEKYCVTTWNAAAERIFGRAAADAVGASFDEFLTRESRGKLAYLVEELARRSEGEQSIWIPDGLDCVGPDGGSFPAEATLSRYESAGRGYFSLVLRDVNERLTTERRIRELLGETAYLREEIDALHGFDEIVGESEVLRRVLADVERVAPEDTTVLITGETGTGKELIARAIHRRSARAEHPLISVNCAAIAPSLQESEFFGHEKGAFTGALARREGRFALAHGGTIFLDEVGEMSLDLQSKLLRVLQEGEYEPVGSSRTLRADVRVVAATNRDLASMAREGTFRSDLMYRLNVFPVHLPALRERGDDVILLAERFARAFAEKRGRTVAPLDAEARAKLLRYDWPGNVRELQNVIERAYLTSTDGIRLNFDRALPAAAAGDAKASNAARSTDQAADPSITARVLTDAELRELERRNIERALATSKGKISGRGGAAEILGIKPNTLASRMKTLGVRGSAADD